MQGFDCDLYIPNGSVLPYKCADHHQDVIGICAKVGLHCYNFQKVTNMLFVCEVNIFKCILHLLIKSEIPFVLMNS